MTPRRICGVILAGGRSQRMGGGDKCLRLVNGRPLLSHVIGRLAPQVAELVLNANGPPDRFAAFGLPVVRDAGDDFAGPLAGLLAGLRWATDSPLAPTHIVSVAGDTPFLPVDLVRRLSDATALDETAIAVARSAGAVHPVFALVPLTLADDLASALDGGLRKVMLWLDRHRAIPVDFPLDETAGEAIDPFFNVNTPDDLARADACSRHFEH